MKYLLLLFVRFYQFFISPWLGKNCRFEPTCSIYTQDAINTHGSSKGLLLSAKRILKCNPFFEGGDDPVPGKKSLTSYKNIYENSSAPNKKLVNKKNPPINRNIFKTKK